MDDKLISNISYTNKDFRQIYPELLDLVKKLSNKWDPSLSNESDPGVLLLKLNALIADKNNYNIDKNVLECFPTSVTQEGNARKLYDSLGYHMHWYQSATSTIELQLKSLDNNLSSVPYITIPLFSMVCDQSSSTVYTIYKGVNADNIDENFNDITISCLDLSRSYLARVIEGKCKTYEINGSKDITLDRLDSDFRLYFDEPNVAENGIFIKTNDASNFGEWKAVDNLQLQRLGTLCYKFGVLPNSSTCYIQFPEDIASLLNNRGASALNINYILSSGAKGNIKSSYLKTFLDDVIVDVVNSDGASDKATITNQISIVQPNGTINGNDPETIDEAYNNYKKSVGTFDTLVTRKDYENAVYNATSFDGTTNLVSNVVVSDRTTDLNSTLKVQSWNPAYSIKNTLVLNNKTSWDQNIEEESNEQNSNDIITTEPSLNAYDIVFYTLSTGNGSYNSTFKPSVNDEYLKAQLSNFLEDNKSVQHNIKSVYDLQNIVNAVYFIYKNIYVLKGQIVTYEKVSASEAAEIEDNVMSVLKAKYNSRNLTFGEETDYSTLLDTIQNADSRIKTVALDLPKYQTYAVGNDYATITNTHFGQYTLTANNEIVFKSNNNYKTKNDETALDLVSKTLNYDEKLTLVARMILAGNVQLFKFDDNFTYDFGYSNVNSVRNYDNNSIPLTSSLVSATTESKITLVSDSDYIVKSNELIQAYAPNYIVKKTYTNYVRVVYYNKTDRDCYNNTQDSEYDNTKTYYINNGDNTFSALSSAAVKNILNIASYGKIEVTTVDENNDEVKNTYTLKEYAEQQNTANASWFYTANGVTYIRPNCLPNVGAFRDFWSPDANGIRRLDSNQLLTDTLVVYNDKLDSVIIKAGENHLVTDNEVIRLIYKDENNIQHSEPIEENTVIQSSVNLYPKATSNYESVNSADEIILKNTESLNIMGLNQCEITSGYNVYWVLNNPENKLQLGNDNNSATNNPTSIILQEGEYFLYKLNSSSDIIMYGPGTRIELKDKTKHYNESPTKIDINNFEMSDIKWMTLTTDLLCTELEIVTAGPGSIVTYTCDANMQTSLELSNTSKTLQGKLVIKPAAQSDADAQEITIHKYPINGDYEYYQVKSRLNLYQNSQGYQELENDSKIISNNEEINNPESFSVQSIKFKYSDNSQVTVSGPNKVYFNAIVLASGGENIDLAITKDGKTSYSLEAYVFETANDESIKLIRDSKGMLTIAPVQCNNITNYGDWNQITLPISFNMVNDKDTLEYGWFIQTNVAVASNGFKVAFTTTYKDNNDDDVECAVRFFNTNYSSPTIINNNEIPADIEIQQSGSYILWIPNDHDYTKLNIYFAKTADEADTITFGQIKKINGFNTDEINIIPNDDNEYSVYDYFNINDKVTYALGIESTDILGYISKPEFSELQTNEEKVALLNKKFGYNIFRKISELIANSSNPSVQYDYTYEVPASDKVLQPTLSSSFFNKNHWANPYTIPQINLDKSSIKVNSYSIKA